MLEEIKESICMKSDFLHRNYKIPMGLQKEADDFFLCLEELGKECKSAIEFEKRFEDEGYSDLLHGLYLRCIPKPERSEEHQDESEDQPVTYLEAVAEEVSEAEETEKNEEKNEKEGFFGLFRKKRIK